MLLKNKTVFVYDVEVFPNLFTCTIKNTESKAIRSYEISDRRNDLPLIIEVFLNRKIMFCGYNNKFYDDILINYLLIHYKTIIVKPVWDICREIKILNDKIIGSERDRFNGLEKYKHANIFESIDLLAMLFSNKLRIGLKELQVTMEYPNVLQYNGDFNSNVCDKDIPEVIFYNVNDVNSTEELLYRCQKDIDLRLSIENEYHISALSKDGVNLGMEILKQRYLAETGLSWNQIKDLRTQPKQIIFKDIIFPFIQFRNPDLQKLLEDLKAQVLIPGDNSFERKFIIGGLLHTFGVGGLHSVNKPEGFEPEEGYILADSDATSLYPTILIEHNLYPKHLGPEFLKVYKQIKDERVAAKRAKEKLKDATLKLSINGLSGNLQSDYSWCCDYNVAYTMRINGQLMMMMLLEILDEEGCKICQTNTDGVLYIMKLDQKDTLESRFTEWSKITKIGLETEYFERFYQSAINDYVGVMKGWSETHDPSLIKRKGAFLENLTLGKGMAPRIIAHAVNKELVEGIPCEKTIKNCQDIKMFLTYQKVSKDFEVEYAGKVIQHINRYYMSNNGYRLYKVQWDKDGRELRRIQMSNSGVTILNKFEEKEIPIKERAINYHYYINEAQKILIPLKTKDLTLF